MVGAGEAVADVLELSAGIAGREDRSWKYTTPLVNSPLEGMGGGGLVCANTAGDMNIKTAATSAQKCRVKVIFETGIS